MFINMSEQSGKIIKTGIRVGKTTLSVAAKVLIALIDEVEDMQYMRTHCYSVIGKDVRSERYESERVKLLYEEKMKRQAVQRLKRQKFIKMRKEGERVIHELTNDGKIKIMKTVIICGRDYYIDDQVCLVSFDFPEAASEARKIFRRFLKSAGFKFVQGSVWSSRKSVAPILKDLVSRLGIKRWVEIYEARQ